MSIVRAMKLTALASGILGRPALNVAYKRGYSVFGFNSGILSAVSNSKLYSTEPKKKAGLVISLFENSKCYRSLSSTSSPSSSPEATPAAAGAIDEAVAETDQSAATAGAADESATETDQSAAKESKEIANKLDASLSSSADPLELPELPGAAFLSNSPSAPKPPPSSSSSATPPKQTSTTPPSTSSSSSSARSPPTSTPPPTPPTPPTSPPNAPKATNDNADDFQIPELKLPSREQVENFLFRAAVVLWDTSIIVYAVLNKVFDHYVVKNPTVQLYWKKFIDRMDETRKERKSK